MCFRPSAIEKPNICPSCGTANPPTNKKCRSCGEKLEHVIADNQGLNEEVAPPPAPPMSPSAPQPPTPASPSAPTAPSSPGN